MMRRRAIIYRRIAGFALALCLAAAGCTMADPAPLPTSIPLLSLTERALTPATPTPVRAATETPSADGASADDRPSKADRLTPSAVPAATDTAPAKPAPGGATNPAPTITRTPKATRPNPNHDDAVVPPVTLTPTPVRALVADAPAAGRALDPVILSGLALPTLTGAEPERLVAFRYEGGVWTQIPVQIDERTRVDLRAVRGRNDVTEDLVVLAYADPLTRVGADPDPLFDPDDELVLMARDAGEPASPFTPPSSTVPGSGVELTLTDPLTEATVGTVYLFEQDGTLDPAAGVTYVNYVYDPLPAPQEDADGFRDQASSVTTAHYQHEMPAAWTMDTLRLTTGDAPAIDLWDRLRVQLDITNCSRSEESMSRGQPTIMVNRSGPIRAIRGYIGANSGSYTQRTHFFYAQRQDIVTDLRVHEIDGLLSFIDYSDAAVGMVYANALNPAGVLIDGVPDALAPGLPAWEFVTGDPGTLLSIVALRTDIPDLVLTSFYSDDVTPAQRPCTGDGAYIGASGIDIAQRLPCTDPARAAIDPSNCPVAHTFTLTRSLYYLAPNYTPDAATAQATHHATPLTVTVRDGLGR